jgi:hypothetical protein
MLHNLVHVVDGSLVVSDGGRELSEACRRSAHAPHWLLSEENSLPKWNVNKAAAALDSFQLAGANREVADYWLGLWKPGLPPSRDHFNPNDLREHLSALAIFEVIDDGPLICRLAGTDLRSALGRELTGQDLLATASEEKRARLIESARTVVDGAVSISQRMFRESDSNGVVATEIALPFFGVTEQGGRRFLMHTEWRPNRVTRNAGANRKASVGRTADRRFVSFCD